MEAGGAGCRRDVADFMTNELGYSMFPMRYIAEGGYVHLKLLPFSGVVLDYKN